MFDRSKETVGLGAMSWQEAQTRNRGLFRNLADDVRGIRVNDVALVNGGVPLRGDLRTSDFDILGRAVPRGQNLDFNEISPDYACPSSIR
jgi:hypothetical protein